jgi:3-oxoacyl-[acyl-carrier-protein] synthase-1
MMRSVFVLSSNILSPLGMTTHENFRQMRSGNSSVKAHTNKHIHDELIWASLFSEDQKRSIASGIKDAERYSKFEQLLIASVSAALNEKDLSPSSLDTIFICSTTKGSISRLEDDSYNDHMLPSLELYASARKLSNYFDNQNDPIVISNACISGVTALIIADRLLRSGKYKQAIVVGADTIGPFVYSGFHSFQALSPGVCKPFSADRDGINLGEAAATMILTVNKESVEKKDPVRVGVGALSNDANHISGPSRTGDELGMAIRKSLTANSLRPEDIGFISAHGTATPYNDEMEAKAIHFAGLQNVPLNSLKAYFGHTLGAAGLIESVISIESMKKGIILPSAGYTHNDLSPKVNVCGNLIEKEYLHSLKIASGFGGCNAAIIYSKN